LLAGVAEYRVPIPNAPQHVPKWVVAPAQLDLSGGISAYHLAHAAQPVVHEVVDISSIGLSHQPQPIKISLILVREHLRQTGVQVQIVVRPGVVHPLGHAVAFRIIFILRRTRPAPRFHQVVERIVMVIGRAIAEQIAVVIPGESRPTGARQAVGSLKREKFKYLPQNLTNY
jgi:hypothetical protein